MAETGDIANKLAPQIDDLKLDEPPEEKNWDNLPYEMKEIVVKEMDYLTRIRFKQCSKESKQLSDSMPIYTKGLVSFSRGVEYDDIEDEVYIDGRKIERSDSVEEDFYEKFLKANVRMKVFRTPWVYDEKQIGSNILKVETAYLKYVDEEDFELWLNRFAPGIENLIITYRYLCLDSVIADHSNVINAKKLQMKGISVNTDQLLKLKARKLQLGDSHVPISGVIRLIQKWIQEDYPIGSELFVSERNGTVSEDQTEYCLRNAGLRYSKKTRAFDNKTEIRIQMKPGKHMEVSPCLKDGSFFISAKVRQSFVEPQSSPSTNWNDMSEEIKGMIVKKMDLFTRNRLKVCSTSDKQLVESTPLHLALLKVDYKKSEMMGRDVLSLQINDTVLRVKRNNFDVCDHFPLTNNLYIRRRISCSTELWKILNSFVMNENVTVEQAEFCNWDFRHIDIKMHAKNLKTTMTTNVRFENLLNFNSQQLEVIRGEVAVPAVNKYLKKWAEKDYPVGSKFVLTISAKDEDGEWGEYEPPIRVSRVPVNSKKYIKVTRYRERSEIHFYDKWIITSEMCQLPAELPLVSSTNWNNMPDEIKEMIVERMDLFTRTKLKLCSTADKQLVESTRLRLKSIYVSDFNGAECFKIDDNLVILVHENDLLICNDWQRIQCRSNKNARDRLKLIINSFVRNAKVTVDCAQFNKVSGYVNGKMRMKARKLILTDVTWKDETEVAVTDSVNRLLKKMIDEDYPIGSSFLIDGVQDVESIPNSISRFNMVWSDKHQHWYIDIGSSKVIGIKFHKDERPFYNNFVYAVLIDSCHFPETLQ